MTGVTLKEFCELLTHNREVEFVYHGKSYVIQPEEEDGRVWLTIWTADCEDGNTCIVREEDEFAACISRDCVERVVQSRCFEGRSLCEIEKEIEVIAIY